MFSFLKKLIRLNRTGSVTMEFVVTLPVLLFILLFIGQFFVAGMAVVETEGVLRDTVRYAAETGDVKKARKLGLERFDTTRFYDMEYLKVEIKDKQVIATSRTRIDLIFSTLDPLQYRSSVKAPVIE